MKSVLKVSLAALTLAFAVSSHAADKKLVVATDTAFVPFEFKQGDKYVGFDVDLWAAIAKELKLDYELKPMDFSGIIPALQTKNVDLALAGISVILIWLSWKRLMGFPKAMRLFACAIASSKAQMAVP